MAMEYRYLRKAAPDVKDDGTLTGRAWPYGAETQIGSGPYGFREVIRRGAGKKSIKDGDIVLLDNHDTRLPLARMSAGTLVMTDTGNGGDWRATPVNTTYAADVVKNVKAKNYGGCSFGFEVIKDQWTDDEGREASPLTGTRREIIEMKVHEISVCTFPAYGQTTVSTKEMVRAARGMSPEDERAASAVAAVGAGGASAPSYNSSGNAYTIETDAGSAGDSADDDSQDAADMIDMICPECEYEAQGAAFCMKCGSPMRAAEGRSANRGGDAPGDGAKPYGNVTYADPGYQSDKKKRYPIDTKKHAKAAWAYISKAKNAAAYTASQLASIKSKIKAALAKFGVTVSPSESKMAEWEAQCDFREMVEGWETMSKGDSFGVLPGDVARAEDVNALARDIKAAAGLEERLACITRAGDFGLSDMLPEHWGGDGNVAKLATEEVTRDMDQIYGEALSLPPTPTALRIMDLASAYLTQEATEDAQRAAEEPAEDPDKPRTTRADAKRAMEDAERRRKALIG